MLLLLADNNKIVARFGFLTIGMAVVGALGAWRDCGVEKHTA